MAILGDGAPPSHWSNAADLRQPLPKLWGPTAVAIEIWITDGDTRRLLGAHIVGEGATELIHIGQAVINLHGTVDFFVENTFNYPTLAEAYKVAGLDAWNRMGLA